jgi:hypothetical protein
VSQAAADDFGGLGWTDWLFASVAAAVCAVAEGG